MSKTAIEWTEQTWNPVTGCDRVSPGCAHCYALAMAARLKAMGQARYQRDGGRSSGPGFGVTLHPDALSVPLRRRKPTMYFVNSMADLFHERVPFDYIERVFAVMGEADQHTFQILTKRHARLAELAPLLDWHPNVWMGVSIENRQFVHRADSLREVDAAVRFISAEPLLGPLDGLDLTGIDWLITGGESGRGHRRMETDWVRELRDRCVDEEIPFFHKQFGGPRPKDGGRRLDGRVWSQMPNAVEAA